MVVLLIVVSLVAAVGLVAWGVSYARLRRVREEAELLASERDDATARADDTEGERAVILQILDGIGEGLVAIDSQRRIVLANRRFADMVHTTRPVVGSPLSVVVRVAGVFSAFDDALAGSQARVRVTIPIGVAERRIEVRTFPLAAESIAAVGIFIDVTQIERLEQIRRNFISDFSHEVRTPMAALSAAVESYEFGGEHITAEEDEQLRRLMGRQLRRMQSLVDDLSELSRIETGDLRLEISGVPLMPLLADLREDFAERAAEKGVRLELRGDDVSVSADALRVQQAFANLIDNAIKYGPEGTAVEIEVSSGETRGIVRVIDHGEGIPVEEKERIFRRFYRIDKSRSQDIAGTGLGLAITKHLVLLQRGTIDVESTRGGGATFVVTLPLSATSPFHGIDIESAPLRGGSRGAIPSDPA